MAQITCQFLNDDLAEQAVHVCRQQGFTMDHIIFSAKSANIRTSPLTFLLCGPISAGTVNPPSPCERISSGSCMLSLHCPDSQAFSLRTKMLTQGGFFTTQH